MFLSIPFWSADSGPLSFDASRFDSLPCNYVNQKLSLKFSHPESFETYINKSCTSVINHRLFAHITHFPWTSDFVTSVKHAHPTLACCTEGMADEQTTVFTFSYGGVKRWRLCDSLPFTKYVNTSFLFQYTLLKYKKEINSQLIIRGWQPLLIFSSVTELFNLESARLQQFY